MDAKGETLQLKRGGLQPGDRLLAIDNRQAVLTRMSGEWWCDCTEWEWDCDIGPGGEVWCTKVCVRYDCTRVPAMGPARA